MIYDMVWSPNASEKRRNRKFRIVYSTEKPPWYGIEYEDGSREAVPQNLVDLTPANLDGK